MIDMALRRVIPAMQRGGERVEDVVQAARDVARKEPKHHIAELLEQKVLAPVASVGVLAAEMVYPVDLDDDAGLLVN